jgi:hypothetical protein
MSHCRVAGFVLNKTSCEVLAGLHPAILRFIKSSSPFKRESGSRATLGGSQASSLAAGLMAEGTPLTACADIFCDVYDTPSVRHRKPLCCHLGTVLLAAE